MLLELTVDQVFAFAVAGTIVSLVLEYFPKLNTFFNSLGNDLQRVIVLASGAVVVFGAWALDCTVLLDLPWVCSGVGLYDALFAYMAYIFSTQGTHAVLPRETRGSRDR